MSSIPPYPGPAELTDKLTIETPEQTDLDFALAGIGSRFLALAFDTLVQILVGIVVFFTGALIGIFASLTSAQSSLWVLALLLLSIFALYFGYFAIFEAIWNGSTPGKRIVGIRVIKDSGRPITPAESVARNLFRIVDQLPGFYAVGIISALLSRQSKRLGDYVAGTVVVHERTLQDIKPAWQSSPPATAGMHRADRLSNEEFALVEAFLNRRSSLPSDVRYTMAAEIARRILPKLTRGEGESFSDEKLLETVAHERRSTARFS